MNRRPVLRALCVSALVALGATAANARQVPWKPQKAPPPKAAPESPAPKAPEQRAFVLLDHIVAPAKDTPAVALAAVIAQVARTRLGGAPGVVLRTPEAIPDAHALVHRRGDLRKLDRPALVALRTTTGLDAVIAGEVHSTPKGQQVTLWHVDLGSGVVRAERRREGPVDSKLFTELEADIDELAASARQSYRVTLVITSTPPDADVRVNGRLACRTPCTKELPDGEYAVEVTKLAHRPWRHRAFYKAGDRVQLVATLYNPLADHYLNREPGVRLDSQALRLGYRYAYFNLSQPSLRELHMFVLDYLLRFGFMEYGVGIRASGAADATMTFPTFDSQVTGRRADEARLFAPMLTVKARVLEKFSFLTLWAGGSLGFANLRSGGASEWNLAGDAFVEVTSRVSRSRNFSFELVFDAGFTYAGQLPYVEKSVSLFGDGPERRRLRPMLGAFAGFALRFVGWNDIF